MGSRLILLRSRRRKPGGEWVQAYQIASGRLRPRYPGPRRQEVAAGNRTKTDTGGWDEYSKALERTLVKELCKLAP